MVGPPDPKAKVSVTFVFDDKTLTPKEMFKEVL
jgi:hypothetical protein